MPARRRLSELRLLTGVLAIRHKTAKNEFLPIQPFNPETLLSDSDMEI